MGNRFASNLKKLMFDHDINAPELAQAVGLTPSSISQYLNGRMVPRENTASKIANFFHITLRELMGDEEPLQVQLLEKIIEETEKTNLIWEKEVIPTQEEEWGFIGFNIFTCTNSSNTKYRLSVEMTIIAYSYLFEVIKEGKTVLAFTTNREGGKKSKEWRNSSDIIVYKDITTSSALDTLVELLNSAGDEVSNTINALLDEF